MKITIQTIPHNRQYYRSPGNWKFDKKGNLDIYVSCLGDWRKEALIAFHELREVLVCKHRGITQQAVDSFDMVYEQERDEGKHVKEDEPGNDPKAPYFEAHTLATAAERALAYDLGVNWDEYAQAVVDLDK